MLVTDKTVLLSLHDVTPRHADKIEAILSFLHSQGWPRVPLLVVPDFHGAWRLDQHPAFVEQLQHWQTLGHELVLHGYWHQEQPDDITPSANLLTSFKRKHLTGGEGEFLSLPPNKISDRIDRGLELWTACGLTPPHGFVPPAWLHNEHLDAVLWQRGFTWTENHLGLRYREKQKVDAPVISWASRDPGRRIASRIVCPNLLRLWTTKPSIRIALHPHDFDWPTLVASIETTLARAKATRIPVSSLEP